MSGEQGKKLGEAAIAEENARIVEDAENAFVDSICARLLKDSEVITLVPPIRSSGRSRVGEKRSWSSMVCEEKPESGKPTSEGKSPSAPVKRIKLKLREVALHKSSD